MDYKITENSDTKTIILTGEITSSKMVNLESVLNNIVENDNRNVIIDLKNVDRLESLSLAVFIGCKNNLSKDGRSLKLVNPNSYVKKVIELASLEIFLLDE